jgi:predicted DNA-binding transcriptional regulator AlpA
MEKLLTVRDVTNLLQISYSTLCRWLDAGTFPQPVNGRNRKLLWTEQSVVEWTNRQSTPVNSTPLPNVSPSQQKRETKAFQQRQEAAKQTLERHANYRKGQHNPQQQKGGQS